MGSLTMNVKEYSNKLVKRLKDLRQESPDLADLEICCENSKLSAHKVILAASSSFFREELSRNVVRNNNVTLALEDFSMKLKFEALKCIVDFIYEGEVSVPMELFKDVCDVASALGIHDLMEYLPTTKKAQSQNCSTQSEEIEQPTASSSSRAEQAQNQPNSQQNIHHQWPPSSNSSNENHNFVPSSYQPNSISTHPPSSYSNYYNYGQHQPTMNNEPQENIIDLDSNSLDGPQSQNENREENLQPRGRLRVINQPDHLSNSENIHDLKNNLNNQPPHSHNQSQNHLDASTSSFMQWIAPTAGANLLTGFPSTDSFEVDNQWYNQYANYNEDPAGPPGSNWTTVTASNWPPPPTSSNISEEPTLNTPSSVGRQDQGSPPVDISNNQQLDQWPPSTSGNNDSNSTIAQKKDEGSDKVKIRPPPPLLAKGTPPRTSVSSSGKTVNKRLELEVRKDLTYLPTAPTASCKNVFQADDDTNSDNPEPEVLEVADDDNESANISTRKFQCVECNLVFTTEPQLRSHIRHSSHRSDVDETLLFCPICKTAVLKGLESLKVHLYKNHGIGEVFRCEDCNYETSIKANYQKHLTTHSETPPKRLRTCDKCGKAFKGISGLKAHEKRVHENGEGLSKCQYCDFRTPQKSSFVKHLAVKHKKGPNGEELKDNFKCSKCSFTCVADHILKVHTLRKHTAQAEMKYKCSICPYATIENAALKKHIRFKHTHDRPFLCNICGFSTHTQSIMKRHKQGHDQSKPHVCQTCGTAYADKKRLNEHVKTHDNGSSSESRPYNCDFCGFSSKRKDNLQAHVKRLHPEMLKSDRPKEAESFVVGHINEDGTIRPITKEDRAVTENLSLLSEN